MSYNFTEEQIKQAYDKLPDNVKDFYSSEKTSVDIFNIGNKYHLHIDAMGKIGKLVGFTLMGLIPFSDFNKELVNQAGVSPDIANLIIYDLNQEVFSKIRRELEELSQTRNSNPVSSENPDQKIKVENTAPQIFDQKMNTIANVPKQEVAVTPQTGDNIVRDPYREPIV
jgi:hypothetical protein